ncbi:hypothetical protein M422DRAFT_233758 [Sphaerobolus stellatus SS14]|uniref:Unplaced genomic scaffold SPHSTscaffold_138, whole genome shotgun sequence n=1 Tax=Sphaerobolus stellatus (strain SS14) TaxID=990650 RepID=A0A0C9UF54_SPHS4|nr:hypothetical protein M422DRAFT_233758 [Sphaerobolus stellatus SS14]
MSSNSLASGSNLTNPMSPSRSTTSSSISTTLSSISTTSSSISTAPSSVLSEVSSISTPPSSILTPPSSISTPPSFIATLPSSTATSSPFILTSPSTSTTSSSDLSRVSTFDIEIKSLKLIPLPLKQNILQKDHYLSIQIREHSTPNQVEDKSKSTQVGNNKYSGQITLETNFSSGLVKCNKTFAVGLLDEIQIVLQRRSRIGWLNDAYRDVAVFSGPITDLFKKDKLRMFVPDALGSSEAAISIEIDPPIPKLSTDAWIKRMEETRKIIEDTPMNRSESINRLVKFTGFASNLAAVVEDLHPFVKISSAIFFGAFDIIQKSEDIQDSLGKLTENLEELLVKEEAFQPYYDSLGNEDLRHIIGEVLLDIAGILISMARNVTNAISVDLPGTLQTLKEDCDKLSKKIDDRVILRKERYNKIAKWLNVTFDWDKRYDEALTNRSGKTGSSFLELPVFTSWKYATKPDVLWISGIPGCGKTVLSAIIINNLKHDWKTKKQSHCMAYVFFDNRSGQHARMTFEDLLRCIIKQILDEISPKIPRSLLDFCRNTSKPGNNEELRRAFENLIQELKGTTQHVYIVLDAIDEFTSQAIHRKKLIDWLKELSSWDSPVLHILVTSRDQDESGIHKAMSSIQPKSHIQLHKDNQQDIRDHIDAVLEAKHVEGNMASLIRDRLIEKARGMFLYIELQLQALGDCSILSTVKGQLEKLPESLDDCYVQILKAVPQAHREHTLHALMWLAFAARDMSLLELTDVASVLHDQGEPRFDEERRIPAETVRSICSSLITVSAGTVRLCHLTVKEFLMSCNVEKYPQNIRRFAISEVAAHPMIARICLGYLRHFSVEFNTVLDWDHSRNSEAAPLFDYSTEYWTLHAREASKKDQDDLTKLVLKFLLPETAPFTHRISQSIPLSPLFFASYHGLYWTAIELLRQDTSQLHEEIGTLGTPLRAAVCGGHKEVVQVLLNKGAKVTSGHLLEALGRPVEGRQDILDMLLERCSIEDRLSTFEAAARRGHKELVQMALEQNTTKTAE